MPVVVYLSFNESITSVKVMKTLSAIHIQALYFPSLAHIICFKNVFTLYDQQYPISISVQPLGLGYLHKKKSHIFMFIGI